MKIKLLLFSVFLWSLSVFEMKAQTSLKDLLNYSLQHSRDIRKADLKCKSSEYTREEAIGNGLPQITASASYSKMLLPEIEIPDQIYSLVPEEYTPILDNLSNLDALYTASAGIQVTQLIYSQSYWIGLKTAKKARELYTILKLKDEEDVISEVATGYYQAGSLMLQIKTIDKSLSNLKKIHKITELSYKNDLVKESSVNRLKVTITNLEVTRQTVQNGIDIQLNYLKALAGMPGDSIISIDTTAIINDFVTSQNENAFSIENVSSYQALLKQEEIYTQDVKMSKAKFLPTLAAFAKINYSSYNTSAEIKKMSNMNTIGLSFSMPIFTSGINRSKIKQAEIKREELHEDISKTKDMLTVNYNNAFLEYQTSKELLEVQKENRDLSLKVYNQTSMQYEEGMASMADLLNVNSDFLQADNSLNQQILKCKTSEIKMLKASGNLKSLIQ